MPHSWNYKAPPWSERCKAARIIDALKDFYSGAANVKIKEQIGFKNVAYVSWILYNRKYNDKFVPLKALEQTISYYEQHKNEPPFVGLTI